MNKLRVWLICGRPVHNLGDLARSEKGVVLPLVLALLFIGSLILTPFLTHASANLTSSNLYSVMYKEKYAADAGVEQAIWDLQFGTLVGRLNAAGGTLSYTLGNQINNTAPLMTVTQSGTGGSGTAGTITQPYIDKYQFDTTGYMSEIINVSGNVYAILYYNGSNRLNLKTVTITTSGAITKSTISSLVVDTTGYEADIIQVAAGIFAIVYRGASNKGYVITLQIAANGIINSTPVAKVTYNTSNNYEPRIANISGNYYAVIYRGPSNKGYLQTLQIAATGIISNSFVSSYVFAATCYEPSLINVSGNYWAVAYRNSSNVGYLTTLKIDTLGVITQSVVSNRIFSSTAAYTPDIQNISSGIFAIAYRGASNRGYILTLAVNSSGIISTPVLSTFVFDAAAGYEPYFRNISGTAYAIFYRGSANDGYIKTLTIAVDGTINTTVIDSYRFDASNGYQPYFIHISGSIYAAVYYGGTGTIGYVMTLEISTDSNILYQIQAVAGGTTVVAGLSLNGGVVRISNWDITR